MSEKFNLKWNDFQSNVSKSFGFFRNEKYLQDITLVSEDLKHVQAHKMVLSACSEFFRNIFQQTESGSKTILCLDGVKSDDLENVLDYVYDGEVKIQQEDLDKFLSIAQKLKLEGLLANNDDTDSSTNKQDNFLIKDEGPNIQDLKQKPKFSTPRASRLRTPPHQPSNAIVAIQNDNGEDMSEEEHKQRLLENIQFNIDDTVTCKVCGKIFGGKKGDAKRNATRHVEVHIEGLTYSCTQCDKTFRSKNSLSFHSYSYHK